MIALDAPVVAVTVLEDRAAVTRRGTVNVAAGQQRIVVERVSPILADKTLTVTCGGARVLDARCERYVAAWRDPNDPDAPAFDAAALRKQLADLIGARESAQARATAATAEVEALTQLAAATYHDLAVSAARGITATAIAQQITSLDAQEAAARARKLEAERESDDLAQQRARLAARLARAEDEAGEQAARLILEVAADAAAEASITIAYVVPGAAWRPYHRAQLTRAAGTLTWETTACVWQATGEDWRDIELTCSLERPSLGVEPPALFDDVVSARRKPDTVVVETRDDEQQNTGLGSGGSPEVPGIDDGGLGLRLSARRVDVRADGAPHRIPVGGFTAPAEVTLVAIPLRSPWVHVRARATNSGTTPLLAGPVDLIMASGYVGRAEVGFVAAGETFEIGFGPEPDVRVHREEERERDDAGLLGGWNVQTIKVAVRLSNLGHERRSITVTERVPVSEIEQVQVTVAGDRSHGRSIDEQGLVTWTVDLAPNGRGEVALEYAIKSQRGVAGV